MDVSPLAGAEERKVRAAKRFARIGLVITLAWMLAVPAFALWFVALEAATVWPLFALYVVALGLHLWRIREHIRSLGGPAPLWFVVVASTVGLALALLGIASAFTGFIWAVITGVLLGDVVGGMRARWIATGVLTAAGIVLIGGYVLAERALAGTGISPWVVAATAAFYVATMWTVDVERLWWLKAVSDLDDARRAAAELATARERLRLADDLHDILGHALEVVAFKTELASRLLAVDPERASAEMEEVQRVARQSLTEVRAVVHDTRSTDLVAELEGARAVLRSAGVALVLRGDPTAVGPTARNVLGRVLREAMTNVLRHAQPSRCTIEIESVGGTARLKVVNDGALPSQGTDHGSGLAALGRYLDERAGRLDAGPAQDGTFQLDAVLPGSTR